MDNFQRSMSLDLDRFTFGSLYDIYEIGTFHHAIAIGYPTECDMYIFK